MFKNYYEQQGGLFYFVLIYFRIKKWNCTSRSIIDLTILYSDMGATAGS